MVATIISPPAVSAVDAAPGVAAGGNVTNNTAVPNIANIDSQASIVELSAQARILSTTAAAAALENTEQNALAFQENIEQLTALGLAAEATLTQNAALTQQTALTSVETSLIDQALQSALADTALNEALATTAVTAANASTEGGSIVAPTLISAPAQPVVVGTPTTATATPIVIASVPTISMAPIAAQAINPAIPNTDPAVAAAIAAYRLGDGLFTERDPRAEQIPQEEELDIVPVPAIQGAKIDLHDSARDDALHGTVWNWVRVHPVQGKLTRR